MAIFPNGYDEKTVLNDNDKILLSDSEDLNILKYCKATNFKGDTGDKGDPGDTGNGISSIVRTSGDGSPGTTDTYTITYTDTTTTTFDVYNGADGSGDMSSSIYDPTSVEGDAFDMDNMAQGTTKKFVTATDITNLGNLSGTNTGDETQATIKTKLGAATASVDGYATSTQITKLDGIEAGAEVNTVTPTNTVTLTNKRITPRVSTETSSATPTINTNNVDAHSITAQAADITSFTTNLSGTPTNFQKLIIRIKDNGTARAITWGASFEDAGQPLPTTTVISKLLTVGFIYNTVTSKWGCVAVANET